MWADSVGLLPDEAWLTLCFLSALVMDIVRPPFVGLTIVSGGTFVNPVIGSDWGLRCRLVSGSEVVVQVGGEVDAKVDEEDEVEEGETGDEGGIVV